MKANWRERIETLLLVTAVSLLVWLYAEGESVKDYDGQSVRVQLVAPQPDTLAISPNAAFNATLRLSASTGQMRSFEQTMRSGPITITVTPDPAQTRQQLILRDLIQQQLEPLGITVLSCQPDVLPATIEPLVEVTLPIRVEPGNLRLASAAEVDPSQAAVFVPQSMADLAPAASITASLALIDADQLEVNRMHTAEVDLSIPPLLESPWTRLAQSQTNVSFTIENRTEQYEPDYLPIRINIPVAFSNQYEVVVGDGEHTVQGIVFVGPRDEIERIRTRQTPVWAELRLTPQQLDEGITSATLYIVKPSDVSVASSPPRVPIQITRRP